MKKTEIKAEDNLNKKKTPEDIVSDVDSKMQDAYSSIKFNVAEGYENVEACKTYDMINE